MGLEQGCRQQLNENISNLIFCLHMSCLDFFILNFLTNSMAIQFNVLGSFMINWVGFNVEGCLVVTK
jgi:hypothetical protein